MREWLINIRKKCELSQQQVANTVGISQSYYSAIESGARGNHLPVPLAKKIAEVLGFDWQRFYEDEKKPPA